MKMHMEAEGWYKLEAIKSDGTVRTLADWFPNLITNAGLDGVGTVKPFRLLTQYCKVGSGSTTPAFTDTALASYVAGTGASSGQYLGASSGYVPVSSSLYYTYDTEVYLFALGAIVGNISEIGVGTGSSNTGILFSRALIKDSGGNPTTLTLGADEQLRVTYELRWYVSTTDVVATQTIAGSSRTVTVRPLGIGTSSMVNYYPGAGRPYDYGWNTGRNYTGWGSAIAAATATQVTGYASISGLGGTDGHGALNTAYVPGTYYADVKLVIGTSVANGTIGALQFGTSGLGTWQIGFSPGIVKSDTQRLELVIRYSWGRYTP